METVFSKIKIYLILFAALFGTACGIGGNLSGSSSKTMTGNVDTAASSGLMSQSLADSSEAIIIKATSASGAEVSTTADASGGFTLTLDADTTYVVSVWQGDDLVGTLTFDISADGDFTTTAFKVDDDDGEITLGAIICVNGACRASENPLRFNDRDGDGINDFEDTDDDGDGVNDDSEEDSDNDGIFDDDEADDDDDDQPTSVSECKVIRVRPFNGETGFDIDHKVRVRFNAEIDTSTVTSDSFYITYGGINVVAGEITFHEEDGSVVNELRLEPTLPLLSLTEYTYHVTDAVQCGGFALAAQLDVAFTTENHDD